MDPLTLAAIMAAAGLAKSQFVDKPKEEASRKMRASEIRYSPWTKMGPSTQIQAADPFGSAIQGGMTGAMLGQNMESADMQKKLAEAQVASINRGSNPWAIPGSTQMAPSAQNPYPNFTYNSPSFGLFK